MSESELEKEADELLRAGKKICDEMSNIPALFSIAISLKRIADKITKPPMLSTEGMSPEDAAKFEKEWQNQNNFPSEYVRFKS